MYGHSSFLIPIPYSTVAAITGGKVGVAAGCGLDSAEIAKVWVLSIHDTNFQPSEVVN